ncbi:MAG: glycerophosphodiester phosphodiesterase family protein [Cyclobacteriaceae bacterium]
MQSIAQSANHFGSDFFEQQEFAHRGGYAYGLENTIGTILTSLENHSQAVEVDVRMTKDYHLVLFHDETIKRVLEGKRNVKVSELSLEELTQIPFVTEGYQDTFVPSLQDMVDTLSALAYRYPNLMVELDFKPHEEGRLEPAVNELLRILADQEFANGDNIYNHFFVSSFYPFVLKSLREKNKKVRTAFAVHNNPTHNKLKGKAGVLFAKMVIRKYDVQILEPNICLVTKRFVNKWHKRGILINTYTANTACQKEYLHTLNIAITTNCPASECGFDKSDQMTKSKKWCKGCD